MDRHDSPVVIVLDVVHRVWQHSLVLGDDLMAVYIIGRDVM